ncbi:MAG: thiamine biosynthesis protein ApbE [Epulopiscium sp. Nele67-Bin005]|nr:MAG: thiamine biosynthesis protein ApbE [Epulopiscium sp. Nele67-Bin005]
MSFKIKFFCIIPLLILILVGCDEKVADTLTSKTEFLMGTIVTISVYEPSDKLFNDCFNALRELEQDLSLNIDNTLLNQINASSGVSPMQINDDLFTLIEKSIHMSQLTDGNFDITIAPLVELWRIGYPDAKVPEQSEIEKVLQYINYENIILNSQDNTLYLSEKNMGLDLGSVAKGYAADMLVQILTEDYSIQSGLIDIGGNVIALGTKYDGTPWNVGIQDPFSDRGESVGVLKIADKSLVTSGIYERVLEENGKTYHHLLNPKTGYPFENDIAGVTIISESSTDGDALSTAVFSMGITNGLAFIESLNQIEAIFISSDYKIYLSSGLKNNFSLLDNNFSLQ